MVTIGNHPGNRASYVMQEGAQGVPFRPEMATVSRAHLPEADEDPPCRPPIGTGQAVGQLFGGSPLVWSVLV